MSRRSRSTCLVILIVLASPAFAMGQTSLTELGAANAARNELLANGGEAAAAAAAPAPAAPAPVADQTAPVSAMKYTLSYALAATLIGLGLYIICRPSHRHATD